MRGSKREGKRVWCVCVCVSLVSKPRDSKNTRYKTHNNQQGEAQGISKGRAREGERGREREKEEKREGAMAEGKTQRDRQKETPRERATVQLSRRLLYFVFCAQNLDQLDSWKTVVFITSPPLSLSPCTAKMRQD